MIFDHIAKELKENNIDFHAPLIVGFGLIRHDLLFTLREEDWVRQLTELYDLLASQYEEISVIGHSLGGLLAVYLTQLRPVKHLVVAAPAIFPDPAQRSYRFLATSQISAHILSWLFPFLPKLRQKGRTTPNDVLLDDAAAKYFQYPVAPVRGVFNILKLQARVDFTQAQFETFDLLFGAQDLTVDCNKIVEHIKALNVPHRIQSAEAILAVPGMACNLQPNSVLVDPDGLLTHIHQVVAAEFAQRKWVSLRTEDELHGAEISLTAMAEAENPVDLIKAWGDFIMHCSAAITVCHLKPPTHRRTLVNLKALMQSQEEQELYHQILEAFGSTQLSEAEVRLFLDQCLAAFDRAIEVKKQPVPFDWKLDPCIRDYLQKGTLEIIDEGAHRESLFWIALFFLISTLAIHQDGSPEEKPAYTARLINFLRALGLESPEAIKRRVQLCMPLHQRVAEYVRKSVATSTRLLARPQAGPLWKKQGLTVGWSIGGSGSLKRASDRQNQTRPLLAFAARKQSVGDAI